MQKIIFMCAGWLLYLLVHIVMFNYSRKVKKICGECILLFAKYSAVKDIVISVGSLLVIGLIYFFDYKFYVDIAIVGCGVVANFIAMKDFHIGPLRGIYENGFCYDGIFITFESLNELTVIDNNPSNPFGVNALLKNGKTEILHFESEEMKNLYLKKIKELKK